MKKLGIIGGTSWTSTALYYEQINKGVAYRLGGLHSAILSVESLDLAPFAAMQQAEDWDGVARTTVEAANRLRASGADGLLLLVSGIVISGATPGATPKNPLGVTPTMV